MQVTAAPGCFCFTSQRGGKEEEESRVGCPVHHMNSEEKQMKSSMRQEEKARSPSQKRSSGEFGEELAKRQRRLDIEEKQTEREEKEKGEKEEEIEDEGKESPEKRLKLSVVGERLAALANQSLAQPSILNNKSLAQPSISSHQSYAQPPILNNQSLAQPPISNNQSLVQVPTSSLQAREESKIEDQRQHEIEAEDDKGKGRETVKEVVAPVNKEVISVDAENYVIEEKTVKESSSGAADSVQSKETEMSKPASSAPTSSPTKTSSPTRTSSPVRTSSPARSSSPSKMTNLPSDDTVVSIFKELETRQRQKQEEVDGCKDCDQHHGGWKLLGFNDQVSFFSFDRFLLTL